MVRVKICGITNVEDALLAARAGADALGLIFAPESPRRVTLARAAAICRRLPPLLLRIGVFVNAPAAEVRRAVIACGLDAVQHFLEAIEPLVVDGVDRGAAKRCGGDRSIDMQGDHDFLSLAWVERAEPVTRLDASLNTGHT
ncbi:MAG: phosphoribosylanthranilate isomerase [Verrucomicrobiae bacterium]|nr:phosphoribosylanthranilate isomerase [Verrucomicrobiae bacterium]